MALATTNPRRTPPRDMSRLQEGRKRQKLSHSPEEESHAQGSHTIADEDLRVLQAQNPSSPEQSAGKWFVQANKIGIGGQQARAEPDDDPPFYMTDRMNYNPTTFTASDDREYGGHSKVDSENEDLRGVIDDLTVENKRLRQMMREQQRLRRDASNNLTQQQDKLFEVRVHGLPPDKKRELESLLKTFASSVHSNVPLLASSTSNASSGQTFGTSNPGASRADSGYASASAATSGTTSKRSKFASLDPASVRPSTTRAVNSYLQDIPDTLLPKHNPLMSERAKQTLVVRRLEQLFTGRSASPGDHDQPIQQQEISQSAAHADRLQDVRDHRKRKAEGSREAHVMPPDTAINFDALDFNDARGPSPIRCLKEVSVPGSPDQRPTRPLDLDIHRAQLAVDNIQYIRHLGLSTPQFGNFSKGSESPWIFLTLLTGLAQLHTLNVTPSFVRHAINKFSKRFELSKDGHKVRWTGGLDGTKFDAEDEKAIEMADHDSHEPAEYAKTGGGSSRQSQTNSTTSAAVTSNVPSLEKSVELQMGSGYKQQQLKRSGTSDARLSTSLAKPLVARSAFDYRPTVYHERLHGDPRESNEFDDTSSAGSNSLVHALSKSDRDQKGKDEGLITFYSNPHFCSDFSSEVQPSNMTAHRPVVVGETLGVPVPGISESPLRYHDATYFTAQFAPRPFNAEQLSDEQRTSLDASLTKMATFAPIYEAGEEETMPLEFDACGLGGVTPEDNFAVDVKLEMKPAPVWGQGAIVKRLPFSGRRYVQKFVTSMQSCEKLDLLPSRLPPPSYIFLTSSSSSNIPDLSDELDDDDDDSYTSHSEGSSSPFVDEEFPAPPAFLQQFSGDTSGDQADDEGNGSEIDMLATARQANPEQIAEQERLYMMHQLGGENRVSGGSLAVTVGASRSASSRHGAADVGSLMLDDSLRSEMAEDGDSSMDDA